MHFTEPRSPVSINISDTVQAKENIRVLIEWKAPSGIGPGFFIQGYNVSIVSESNYSNSYDFTYATTSLNVTLDFSVMYTASVVAINCAGESEPLILSDILFSELLLV